MTHYQKTQPIGMAKITMARLRDAVNTLSDNSMTGKSVDLGKKTSASGDGSPMAMVQGLGSTKKSLSAKATTQHPAQKL